MRVLKKQAHPIYGSSLGNFFPRFEKWEWACFVGVGAEPLMRTFTPPPFLGVERALLAGSKPGVTPDYDSPGSPCASVFCNSAVLTAG